MRLVRGDNLSNNSLLTRADSSAMYSMHAFDGVGEDSEANRMPLTPSEVEFELERRKCWWKMQNRLRSLTEKIAVRITIFIMLVIDLVLMCVEFAFLSESNKYDHIRRGLLAVSCVICLVFALEILIRIMAWGLLYWKNIVNCIDFVIVLCLFCITIVDVVLEILKIESNIVGMSRAFMILRLIRLPRLFQFIRVIYTQREFLAKSTRLVVSQNKRRYRQDGFDLDLCYVTDRVIAMSFPSSGLLAFYRNPIEEVSRFLDSKHFGRYWVYNLCSERAYDINYFHDRVTRIMIDDHNVPLLSDMLEFAKSSQAWLEKHPKNVLVVHCKGGKGRTGTMICTHLIHAGEFETAEECLEYFGQQRTDLTRGKTYQGVETPSQYRYVGYYESVKAKKLDEIVDVRLSLVSVTLNAISGVGRGDGSDFSIDIFLKRVKVFSGNLNTKKRVSVKVTSTVEEDRCIITDFKDLPVLAGDVKISFATANKKIPHGYEKRPFFFWFHTSFIDTKTLKLVIPRNELDNLHKPSTWHVFRENFSVELMFERP